MKVEKRVQTRLLMGLRGRLARDSLTQILDERRGTSVPVLSSQPTKKHALIGKILTNGEEKQETES